MTNSPEPNAEELFERFKQLPAEERLTFVEEHCTSEALRDDLMKKLETIDGGFRDFLSSSDFAREDRLEAKEQQIGPYRLLQKIGEGGFGDVYMARQERPVQRTVALKLLKPGMDSREVVARFEAERQALAMMNHPHIATVLDVGTTELGHPYFVMELVKGIPITEYCDKSSLPMKERLRLFVDVCRAVQHAHQKGIVHRDLKPSNIMVTLHGEIPVPKVIDFGVAKAINQPLTENTLFTRYGAMVGTPAYMSPEQAGLSGLDIDTRSDVYSLGVILYELLTGTTPIERSQLESVSLVDLQRLICEEELPTPSTRLKSLGGRQLTIPQRHKNESSTLRRRLRAELDWIAMRALEKDRARRYESASALAADIERHLRDEPVDACPPELRYKVRNFARRHRVALSVVATVLVVLAIATTVSTWQAIVAMQLASDLDAARDEALELAQEAAQKARIASEREEIANVRAQELRLAQQELRNQLYVSCMRQLGPAYAAGNVREMNQLLETTRPGPGETDLRGFEWYYWWRAIHRDSRTMFRRRGGGPNYSMTVSPNDRWVVVPYYLNALQVFDVARPGRVQFLKTMGDPREAVFSPDGKILAVGAGGNIELFDAIDNWSKLRDLRLSGGFQEAHLAFSPAGTTLASASLGRAEISFWDTETWNSKTLELRDFSLSSNIAYSPDGTRIALASERDDRRVVVLNLDAGMRQASLGDQKERITSVAWSPDGQWFVAGDSGGTIHFWDEDLARVSSLRTPGTVSILRFSPDSAHLAASVKEINTVFVWNTGSNELVATLKGHRLPVTGLSFVGDSTTLWTAGRDRRVKIWDLAGVELAESRALGPLARDFVRPVSTDLAHWPSSSVLGVTLVSGRRVVVAHVSGRAVVQWNLDGAGGPTHWGDEFYAVVALSDDGRFLLAAMANGVVRVWDCPSGRLRREHRVDPAILRDTWDAVLSRNGRYFAVTRREGRSSKTTICDLEQGVELLGPEGPHILQLAISADGTGLVTRTNFGFVVEFWGVGGDQLEKKAAIQGGPPMRSIALSADGSQVAIGRWDNKIRLYDFETGAFEKQLEGHAGQVTALAYSLDGKALISGSVDKTVRVWSLERGELLTTLNGHRGMVDHVSFTADSQSAVSVSTQGGLLKVWERATEAESRSDVSATLDIGR